MNITYFEFLRAITRTEDGLILYALALIVILEMIDFASGTFAALINPEIEYKSKVGINGLIRKVVGIFILLILIPMSVFLPENTGFAFLYMIYIGYIVFSFQSLVENYKKMKGNSDVFKPIIQAFQRLIDKGDGKS